jgi:hypothetical protein
MEGSTKDALMVRGQPIDRDKGKFFNIKYKSKVRYKSHVQSTRRCWKCSKFGNSKGTTSQRQWKSVHDLMRSIQLRERLLYMRDVICI